MRRRLDTELVRRGLVRSRSEAVVAIREMRVTVGGAPADNPARLVESSVAVHVGRPSLQFVSRGGLKLAHALDTFAIDPAGGVWLDAGASTGGFTDCLLQRGAQRVHAVDVGHGQLAWPIRSHDRVVVYERMNVRSLAPSDLGGVVDGCVADLSFISLLTVAPALMTCVVDAGPFVLLIKPQFEAGPARIGKGGVIRDPDVRTEIVVEVVEKLAQRGLVTMALTPSPISGADGNREFLALARLGGAVLASDVVANIVLKDAGTTNEPSTGQNGP